MKKVPKMTQSTTKAVVDQMELDVPDAEIVSRATALIPLVRDYAAQGSEARRVAPEVVKALTEAGLFHTLVPKRLGGSGASLRTAFEAVAEIARGDGSTGWITALMTLATGFSSTFSQQCQDDILGANPSARICGIFSPGETSERVEGGYRVSGRWPYASGSFAADWASITIVLESGEPGTALIPREAFTIEPSWFVAGMQGTGSDTVVVKDHFVPDYRIQSVPDMMAARFSSPHTDEHLVSMPFNAVAAAVLVAPQVGLGRHALEVIREKLPTKYVTHTSYAQAKDSPTHQLNVAKAATKLQMAELLFVDMCNEMDHAAAEQRSLDPESRARLRNNTGVVAELVKEEIDLLLTANGAGSFADSNVLNRIWRDSETASRHALVTTEIGREAYGRLLLGNTEPVIGL